MDSALGRCLRCGSGLPWQQCRCSRPAPVSTAASSTRLAREPRVASEAVPPDAPLAGPLGHLPGGLGSAELEPERVPVEQPESLSLPGPRVAQKRLRLRGKTSGAHAYPGPPPVAPRAASGLLAATNAGGRADFEVGGPPAPKKRIRKVLAGSCQLGSARLNGCDGAEVAKVAGELYVSVAGFLGMPWVPRDLARKVADRCARGENAIFLDFGNLAALRRHKFLVALPGDPLELLVAPGEGVPLDPTATQCPCGRSGSVTICRPPAAHPTNNRVLWRWAALASALANAEA